MDEEILNWLQSEDDNSFDRAYQLLYQTIIAIVKGDDLFRTNRFSNEDAEEWTNDVLMRLNRVRQRIDVSRFIAFARRVVRNYIIDRINERRDEDGIIPHLAEFLDSHDTDRVQITLDENKKILTAKKEKNKKRIYDTPLFKYLSSDPQNNTFKHLIKWMLWKNDNENTKIENPADIIPKADLRRTHFVTLEPSDYNVIVNPISLIAKYDLWLNHDLTVRDYLWQAIDKMVKSEKEIRDSPKPDPMVGAVLVDENGIVIANAWRGKDHDEGKGHCEYRLLEHEMKKEENRKYIYEDDFIIPEGLPGAGTKVTRLKLKTATLYVTLEPCSGRNAPKLSCADRIIHSGIKTVCIGLKDPDSNIDGNGIKKLEDAGITVKYFHQDLLFEIIIAKNQDDKQQNLEFIKSKKEFYIQEQPELFVNNVLEL